MDRSWLLQTSKNKFCMLLPECLCTGLSVHRQFAWCPKTGFKNWDLVTQSIVNKVGGQGFVKFSSTCKIKSADVFC